VRAGRRKGMAAFSSIRRGNFGGRTLLWRVFFGLPQREASDGPFINGFNGSSVLQLVRLRSRLDRRARRLCKTAFEHGLLGDLALSSMTIIRPFVSMRRRARSSRTYEMAHMFVVQFVCFRSVE
jgi:hypothetical protein